jgi:PDZ domain-containing protein
MKRFLKIAAFVLAFGLIFAVGYIRLPYYAVGPGPAREVTPLIDVQGHPRYPSAGRLIMTTVRWYQVTPLQALVAWADPHQSVVSKNLLYPPGQDAFAEQRRAISQMDQSKIDATYVVLADLENYPKDHGSGALIEVTGQDCPADGKLFAGDTIVAIDGHPVASAKAASELLDAAGPGEPIDFRVRAAGQTHDVEVAKGRCPGADGPLVGISIIDAFPFRVEISSGDVGGPSAGLMFALGLYDDLTPGDLTQGRTIAGTGTIDPDGNVGPIGGITDKVVAAERVGASIFLVPQENMAELEGVDTGDMRLISIATFKDAVDALSEPA